MACEIVVDTKQNLAVDLSQRFANAAAQAIVDRGRFNCVLPGGSVAETFFPQLAALPVDWRRVDFFWGDERAVPADAVDSNYRLAKELWLDRIDAAPERVHRMASDAMDLDVAAQAYANELHTYFSGRPRFDMVLLGAGPDGHVCSLFPEHSALHDPRFVVAVRNSPKPPPERLTLTLAALEGAATLIVAAFGKEKAAVFAEARKDQRSQLPVALAARGAARSVFMLDADAASSVAAS